jgi:methyl-accepting chemotaxis protein
MQALSQATRAQTQRIEDIVGNVDAVMKASGQTESVIKQSLQSAADLEQASSEMFSMVQRFRIGDMLAAVRRRLAAARRRSSR